MASVLKVDKLDPQSGTALEIGTSGDTVSIPSGATLDISASTLTPPATMPASSGVNLTALNATNLGSGTVDIARGGTGAATLAGAGLTNAPSFSAYMNAAQLTSSAANTLIIFTGEAYDTDNAYDTTTGRFTVPAGEGGKYFFTAGWVIEFLDDTKKNTMNFWRNGVAYTSPSYNHDNTSCMANQYVYNQIQAILTLSAADYITLNSYQTNGTDLNILGAQNHFGCYKLIGI